MLSTSIHTFSLTALFNRWFKSVSLPVERSTEKYTLESPREGQPKASDAAPLDPSLFKLAEGDMDFLHDTVTSDDDELRSRIFAIQKKSYATFPYPCVLNFAFVTGKLRLHPVYERVLEAGKRGDTVFLDIGCAMGTDVRRLAYDGYPAKNMLATDLRQSFLDEGHELYGDARNSPIRFFTSDVFEIPAPTSSASCAVSEVPLAQVTKLADLQGQVTHMYMALLFHLFDEAAQYEIALKVGTLLRRTSGCIVFGRHQGSEVAQPISDSFFKERFLHSPESWRDMWIRVFTELEDEEFAMTRVAVDARVRTSGFAFGKVSGRVLDWSVSIL
ncbi:hypothetical protein HWV62_35782 [Athelia sp. TMB]|nr:hypothetical protein HWV62_35782 [Athelia sp. TMB]